MFEITEYSAFNSTTRATFAEAVEVATGYASFGNGGLPATIRDSDGGRWVVYEGGQVEQMAGVR